MTYVNRTRRPECGTPPDVEVPAAMNGLHWLVMKWIAVDRQKCAEFKRHSPKSAPLPSIADGEHDRQLRLYSSLLTALEARGHTLDASSRIDKLKCLVSGEPIEFFIRRHPLRRRVPLSREELADFENIAARNTMKWEETNSGHLLLQASAEYAFKRHQWADRFGRPLESQLGEAVLAFEAMAKVAAIESAKQRRWQERYQRQEEQLQRIEYLQAQRDRGWEELQTLAAKWNEATRLRQFLALVEQRLGDDPAPRTVAWLEWVHAEIDAFDPFVHGDDYLFQRLPRLKRGRAD